jgi:hypothetical protein
MPCSQHLSARGRKTHLSDAPYNRRGDWWKGADQSWQEKYPSRYSYKTQSYHCHQDGKSWSIVVLPSGLRETTAASKFRYYAEKWKNETGGDSSLTNITSNMNYLRIIRIGDEAIPLILQELQRESAPWFVALRAISEDDSVGRDSPGDFRKMAAAWIQWGKDHGHI